MEDVNASVLNSRDFNGYLRRRIPHKLDDIVKEFVNTYRSASAVDRQQLTSGLTPRAAGVLSSFGERMAAVAVRARSDEYLRLGLVGMGLAEGRLDDPRANLIVLAAVNHSAIRIGTNLRALVDEIAFDLPAQAVAAFRAFTQRDDRDKSLRAMGLGTIGSGDDFRYVSG